MRRRAFLGLLVALLLAVAALGAGEPRVVFLGDSLTAQWDLAASFPGKPYVNAGIAGNTAEMMLVRFRRDVVAQGPAAVVVLAGINDIGAMSGYRSNEEIEAALQSICDLAAANRIAVVIATLLPDRDPYLVSHPMARIQAVNELVRAFAARRHLTLVDSHPVMLGPDGLLDASVTTDGLHLNATGYARLIPLVKYAIERATGEVP